MDGARTATPVMEVTGMVIRNKEYYSQFDEEMKRAKRTMNNRPKDTNAYIRTQEDVLGYWDC